MYLLLLDKLYILRLWSEQIRQMNRRRLQKLIDEYTDSVFIYLPKTLSMQISRLVWIFIYKNTLEGSNNRISQASLCQLSEK